MFRSSWAIIAALLIAQTVSAEVKTKAVPYEHDGQKLEGHLAWDDALPGKRPGVLIVHEWWGLNDYARGRAEQLAKLGYVAFALDMYGKGKTTKHPKQAGQWAAEIRKNVEGWRARAKAGLKLLLEHELVDAGRIAAIGYCFGGSTVLQLAYAGEDLSGVVSFHGALPVPEEDQAKAIKAKILVCHGAADSFIPEKQIQEFRGALEKAGADWQMIYYSGARHSFTNPHADQAGVEGIKYDKQADARSWAHMRQFFDEMFAAKQ